MSRRERRHPDEKGAEEAVQPADRPQSSQQDALKAGGQDVQSVRAKITGHGKKTADKWNQ